MSWHEGISIDLRGICLVEELVGLGISAMPCGGDDGKKPLFAWKKYQEQLPLEQDIKKWAQKYDNSNVAIITGKISNITVVDIDDPSIDVNFAQSEYGLSEYIVRTPSGGLHLYYLYNPDLRTKAGYREKVDIRSEGGYVVAAGSVNPKTGGKYTAIKGGIPSLKKLTPMKKCDFSNEKNPESPTVSEGNRNNALFCNLKEVVLGIENFQDFLEHAYTFNVSFCSPPLPEKEVEVTAKSVWKYKMEGRVFATGGGRHYHCDEAAFKDLSPEPRAYVLWQLVFSYHNQRKEPFCIDQNEVAKILGWTDSRSVASAIRILMSKGYLSYVGKQRRANLYKLHTKIAC